MTWPKSFNAPLAKGQEVLQDALDGLQTTIGDLTKNIPILGDIQENAEKAGNFMDAVGGWVSKPSRIFLLIIGVLTIAGAIFYFMNSSKTVAITQG